MIAALLRAAFPWVALAAVVLGVGFVAGSRCATSAAQRELWRLHQEKAELAQDLEVQLEKGRWASRRLVWQAVDADQLRRQARAQGSILAERDGSIRFLLQQLLRLEAELAGEAEVTTAGDTAIHTELAHEDSSVSVRGAVEHRRPSAAAPWAASWSLSLGIHPRTETVLEQVGNEVHAVTTCLDSRCRLENRAMPLVLNPPAKEKEPWWGLPLDVLTHTVAFLAGTRL